MNTIADILCSFLRHRMDHEKCIGLAKLGLIKAPLEDGKNTDVQDHRISKWGGFSLKVSLSHTLHTLKTRNLKFINYVIYLYTFSYEESIFQRNLWLLGWQKKSINVDNSTYLPKISDNYCRAGSGNIIIKGKIIMIIAFYFNFPFNLTKRAGSPIMSWKVQAFPFIFLSTRDGFFSQNPWTSLWQPAPSTRSQLY